MCERVSPACVIIGGYNRVGSYFHDTMTVLRIPAVIFEGWYLSHWQLVSQFYGLLSLALAAWLVA